MGAVFRRILWVPGQIKALSLLHGASVLAAFFYPLPACLRRLGLPEWVVSAVCLAVASGVVWLARKVGLSQKDHERSFWSCAGGFLYGAALALAARVAPNVVGYGPMLVLGGGGMVVALFFLWREEWADTGPA